MFSIAGCYDGYIYCIHLKTGDTIWKFQTEDMVKCTAITCMKGSKIFVGSYDFYVYCLSPEVIMTLLIQVLLLLFMSRCR